MKHKVLLVDDGNERLEHVVSGLRDAGYIVVTVKNANLPTLQEQIRQHQPDFLMLDEDNIIDLSDKNFQLSSVAAA